MPTVIDSYFFNYMTDAEHAPFRHDRTGGEESAFGFAADFFALVFFQQFLTDAYRGRGNLDQLIVVDKLHRLLEAEAYRGRQQDVFIRTCGTDIRQLLAFQRIHDEIVIAAVEADDHAFIDFLGMADKEATAFL